MTRCVLCMVSPAPRGHVLRWRRRRFPSIRLVISGDRVKGCKEKKDMAAKANRKASGIVINNGALRVLVPFDGSAIAEAAIKPMLASMRDLNPDVLLLQVVVAPRGGAAGSWPSPRPLMKPCRDRPGG